ncbi:hypothetical protein ACPOL_1638 [Acidisarcina polymorpha]|uniref:Uncharacterized protein n=1 Tax=Acidisarcina polymorpha TaxID=2211140 RepID=A0A2Z5FWT9_9BACT|nr:hypothetical protein ACPOL_1638 [Acidisarcina polymorpha]
MYYLDASGYLIPAAKIPLTYTRPGPQMSRRIFSRQVVGRVKKVPYITI